MTDTLQSIAARLSMRVSQRWDGTPEQQAEYARKHASRRMMSDETDVQIASRVRMLMRDELDHEAVVTVARDRICALAVERSELLEALILLVADVEQYPAWARPCHAVDVARAALAKALPPNPDQGADS